MRRPWPWTPWTTPRPPSRSPRTLFRKGRARTSSSTQARGPAQGGCRVRFPERPPPSLAASPQHPRACLQIQYSPWERAALECSLRRAVSSHRERIQHQSQYSLWERVAMECSLRHAVSSHCERAVRKSPGHGSHPCVRTAKATTRLGAVCVSAHPSAGESRQPGRPLRHGLRGVRADSREAHAAAEQGQSHQNALARSSQQPCVQP